MRVNSIIHQNYAKNNDLKSKNSTNNLISRQNKLERAPQCDSISFKSRFIDIEKILDNNNTVNGLKFAENLFMEIYRGGISSLQTVEKVVHKQYPEVAVKHIRELAKVMPNSENYRAYSSHNLDAAFNRFDYKMYISPPKNMQEIPGFISDASHEYTHLSQDFNGTEDIDIIKQASKGNRTVAETLRGIYESTFRVFDTNIPEYMPLVKEQDGNKVINSQLKGIIRQFLSQIVEDKDPTHMNDVLSAYSNVDDLIFDVKKYCSLKSKQEKEAYATEYVLNKNKKHPASNAYREVAEFFSNLEEAFISR